MRLRLYLVLSLILCGCNKSPDATPTSSASVLTSTGSAPNLLPVKVSGKWGYADTSGKLIVNPQFDFADPFEEDRARICLGKSGCDEYAIYAEGRNDSMPIGDSLMRGERWW